MSYATAADLLRAGLGPAAAAVDDETITSSYVTARALAASYATVFPEGLVLELAYANILRTISGDPETTRRAEAYEYSAFSTLRAIARADSEQSEWATSRARTTPLARGRLRRGLCAGADRPGPRVARTCPQCGCAVDGGER